MHAEADMDAEPESEMRASLAEHVIAVGIGDQRLRDAHQAAIPGERQPEGRDRRAADLVQNDLGHPFTAGVGRSLRPGRRAQHRLAQEPSSADQMTTTALAAASRSCNTSV